MVSENLVKELRRVANEAPNTTDGHGYPVRPYWTYRALNAADRIAELEAEVAAGQEQLDQAFSMLSVCGVPKQRARYVATGIDVLATRFRKEVHALHIANSQLEAQNTALKAKLEKVTVDGCLCSKCGRLDTLCGMANGKCRTATEFDEALK